MLSAVGASLLLVCAACGSSSKSSNTGTVSITISPQTVTIPVTTSQQFSATVGNSSNTSVTWQVNGTTGGSSTYGTISSSGLYTAPTSAPASTITVEAVAQADTSKTASATVTVTNSNKLVISPAQATLAAGGQQTFSVTLGGQVVDAAWSISCGSPAGGACGTISSTGVYTAPLSPPHGGWVTVTASSTNNTASAANAGVVVTCGSGTLFGQYSFDLAGVSAGRPFSAVGSITFDGKGGVAGGAEDQGGETAPITITGGTYSFNPDGRVTATIHTDSGDEAWQIVVVNHARAVVMRVDSVIARGGLDLQNSAQFGHALSGNFSFRLAGKSPSATIPVSAMVGALSFDLQGNITSGVLDVNDGGTVSPNLAATGTSTATSSSNGRGTLSLSSSFGAQTFAYYVVDSTSAKFIETDAAHVLTGKLVSRTSSSTVDTSYFSGSYAFVFTGANSSGTTGQGGTFTVDASGNVSNATFDMATDSAFALGFLFSGSFAVSDPVTGRTTATFNVGGSTLQYVVYPPGPNYELAFLEIDNKNVTSGLALRQALGGLSIQSLSGNFVLLADENGAAVHRTIGGIVALGSAPTGALDLDDNGTVTLDTALQNSSFSLTSLYGRGALQLQAGSYQASYTTYAADSGTVLMMETDGKAVLAGEMERQD